MDTGLFVLNEKFLLAILRLEDANNSDWQIVRDHIRDVSDILTEQGLHAFPDYKMNYSERLNFTRGFAAALDVLKNIFKNSPQLIEEFREQEEVTKAIERENTEEGASR